MFDLLVGVYLVYVILSIYLSFKLSKKDYENGIDLTFFDLFLILLFILTPIGNMYFVHAIGKDHITLDFTILKGKKK